MITDSLGFTLLIFALGALLAAWYYKGKSSKYFKQRDRFTDGLRAIVMDNRPHAMKILREVAIEDTDNIEAFILLGDLVREEMEPRKALQIHLGVADRAALSDGERARVMRSLALDYEGMGDHEAAADSLIKSLDAEPDRWTKEFLLEVLEKLGRWEDAFDLLSSLKGADKERKRQLALYKVMAGNVVAESEKYHAARLLFKTAIRIDQECPSAYMRIGDAYYAEGRTDDAVEWWTKFCGNFPDIAWSCFERLERAAYDQGDFGRMISFYGDLIAARPDDYRAREALADLFGRMGRIDDAIATLRNAQSLPLELELLDLLRRRDGIGGETGEVIERINARNEKQPKYICESCGYHSEEPVWYCPKCGAWNSFGI
ncbi:tetratricopeptide repeat protein [bacterium]|nr:tetratricopeptide repeat protein [bacterium]